MKVKQTIGAHSTSFRTQAKIKATSPLLAKTVNNTTGTPYVTQRIHGCSYECTADYARSVYAIKKEVRRHKTDSFG